MSDHPDHPVLSPRQIELKRLISEAREMKGRWGGLAALLERIERNDTLDAIGGEEEAIATAHNSAVSRAEETASVVERLWALLSEQEPTSGAQRTLSGKAIERCILNITAEHNRL